MAIKSNRLYASRGLTMDIPSVLRSWLYCESSLTDKLRMLTGDARLSIIREGFEAVDALDYRSREIEMYSHGVACWYAKTMIQLPVYLIHDYLFHRLNTEPLGALLYDNPDIERTIMHIEPLFSHQWPYELINASLTQGVQPLWMRQSTFSIKKRDTFTLTEVFLPGLLRIIACDN